MATTPLTKQEATDLQNIRSTYSPFEFMFKIVQLERKKRKDECSRLAKWMEAEGMLGRLERRHQIHLHQILGSDASLKGYGDLGEAHHNETIALLTEMKDEDLAAGKLSPKNEKYYYQTVEMVRKLLQAARNKHGDPPLPAEPEDEQARDRYHSVDVCQGQTDADQVHTVQTHFAALQAEKGNARGALYATTLD